MAKIKILGICGSQRKGGNCEKSLAEALKAGSIIGGVETELVSLSKLEINHCDGCYRCYFKGTRKNPCPEHEDDMTKLYSKIAEADGYIFASPVYFGTVTSTMKAFMDRTLPFVTGYYAPDSTSEFKETLRFRPAAAIAVGGGRNDGIETTLYTFYRFFLYHDMLPVSAQIVGSTIDSNATSFGGAIFSEDKPDAPTRDKMGRGTIQAIGKKVAYLAKTLKPARTTVTSQKNF